MSKRLANTCCVVHDLKTHAEFGDPQKCAQRLQVLLLWRYQKLLAVLTSGAIGLIRWVYLDFSACGTLADSAGTAGELTRMGPM